MQDIIKSDGQIIKDLIYEIRGQQVMLDSDLAKLYEVETKVFLQSVKRNPERFPEGFMFQLTNAEFEALRSQFVTSNEGRGGRRYNPFVFTEQGVAMLSGVLRSEVAAKVSIQIMNAFVAMRHLIDDSQLTQKYFNEMTIRHDSEIKLLQDSFRGFKEKRKDSTIFFDGQFFDAYSKICDIFKEAKESLVIIDSYSDRETLKIIKNLTVHVTIITSSKSLLSKQDIEKYNKQYNNLKVIVDNTFHDRYFILDDETVYCCGTSLNYLGRKTFSVIKVSDKIIATLLQEKISTILGQ